MNTQYCIIDTSRVEEEDEIRQAIEKNLRETEGQETWRCAAVIRDPKNINRIKVTCRDGVELRKVKEAAQKKQQKAPGYYAISSTGSK